jgi:periplasmic protein TonB
VNDIKFPLAASVMGHAIGVVLLMLLVNNAPRLPEPIAKGGVQVMFEPALPKDDTAPPPMPAVAPETPPPPAEPPPPEPQAETVPPPPEPPVTTTEPTPPAPEAPVAATELPPPPQPPKPAVKKPPKLVPRHQEMPRPTEVYTPPVAHQLPAAHAPSASPQTAFAPTPVPAPAPAPQASAGYRALLSAWLENHKRYPDAARQRGEEGRAVLRFEVDRNGRVLDYTVASSSGYPDLDQSIEEMMRGATLPPFPADMPQPRMEVSVTIRFSLRR